MPQRLRIGDVVRYRDPYMPSQCTGIVIGHPHHAAEHDVVVIAPDPAQGRRWEVLNDDWCSQPLGRDPLRARRERYRLRQGAPRGFLQKPPRGWSR